MYYGDSVRHLLLTPITKYRYAVQGSSDKCLTKKITNTCIMVIL